MFGFVQGPYTQLMFNLPDSREKQYYIDEVTAEEQKNIKIDKELLRKEALNIGNWDELTVVRHFISLSQRNFCVDTNFYPLGSCTMKYNPKICEELVESSGAEQYHPHLITEDLIFFVQGYLAILWELERFLQDLTGMSRFTFQPMAGANGEFCGVAIISAYHRKKGQKRKFIIIPDAAHGTNPASAALCGFDVVNVTTRERGYLQLKDIESYLNQDCAGLMLTCPNTLGLFNPQIREISNAVHKIGGLLYYDGANFNALMGNVKIGDLGFDIVHLNLHKSFSTPHGCGGPGAGPVGVIEELVGFLPVPLIDRDDKSGTFFFNWELPNTIGKIAPFLGNFTVLIKAYIYLRMMGLHGCSYLSKLAVLNANYLRKKISEFLDVPYLDQLCMHEFVASVEQLKKEKGITALDIAKALIDRGIHPPTVYFPLIVKEALMIEPTETESKYTLDYFICQLRDIINMTKEEIQSCPKGVPISRPDEVRAVRNMDLAV